MWMSLRCLSLFFLFSFQEKEKGRKKISSTSHHSSISLWLLEISFIGPLVLLLSYCLLTVWSWKGKKNYNSKREDLEEEDQGPVTCGIRRKWPTHWRENHCWPSFLTQLMIEDLSGKNLCFLIFTRIIIFNWKCRSMGLELNTALNQWTLPQSFQRSFSFMLLESNLERTCSSHLNGRVGPELQRKYNPGPSYFLFNGVLACSLFLSLPFLFLWNRKLEEERKDNPTSSRWTHETLSFVSRS